MLERGLARKNEKKGVDRNRIVAFQICMAFIASGEVDFLEDGARGGEPKDSFAGTT